MYANMAIAQIQPGKLNEFIATWEVSILPAIKDFPGFKSYYLLTDVDTDKAIGISIYETKADADRTQSSGDYQKLFGVLAAYFVPGSVSREEYEVNRHLT